MKRHWLIGYGTLILCFGFTSLAKPVEPTESPAHPRIRLPEFKPANQPQPAPPDTAIPLNAGEQYVFDADADCVVMLLPEGFATLSEKSGPRSITARFAGGKDDEDRDYTGKFVYVIKPKTTGTVTLVTFPLALGGRGEILKRTLDIKIGPRPPPTPIPVVVDPHPADNPFGLAGFRVLIIRDTTVALPRAQQAIFNSVIIRNYAAEKCAKGADTKTPDFRIFDKGGDVSKEASHWQHAAKRARTTLPWIVISNAAGNDWTEEPLPDSIESTLTLLKKFGE